MPSFTETLEFENARALQALFGSNTQNLRKIEEVFSVTITTRDGWLKIEGRKEDVVKARTVFEHLQQARDQGVDIRSHEFNYAVLGVSQNRHEGLKDLYSQKVTLPSARRTAVLPKTIGQKEYLESIRQNDVCFGIGPAGTGKTYLAVAMAVASLKQESVQRIILTRPAVETGESLGYLPGDLREKITPYLRPLYDALQDMVDFEEIQKYMDRGIIEIAPLAYMRGRTLARSFIILDEAQNTTSEQMFMFLTRLGMGSKCVITGDMTQTDLPANKKSGLVESVAALRKVPGVGFQFFDETDVVRHELVARIVRAYRAHREPLAAPTKTRKSEK